MEYFGVAVFSVVCNLLILWSGRRDSNPRRPAWEAGILPLNYSRSDSTHKLNKMSRVIQSPRGERTDAGVAGGPGGLGRAAVVRRFNRQRQTANGGRRILGRRILCCGLCPPDSARLAATRGPLSLAVPGDHAFQSTVYALKPVGRTTSKRTVPGASRNRMVSLASWPSSSRGSGALASSIGRLPKPYRTARMR